MSDNKSTFTDKAAKVAAVVTGAVAAAAVIPQDELVKKGLPSLWDAVKGTLETGWLTIEEYAKKFRPTAFRWTAKLYGALKWWLLVALALVLGGVQLHESYGSNVARVLVALGTLGFAGLGIALVLLWKGLTRIAYMKLKIAGGVFGKAASLVGADVPTVIDKGDFDAFAKKAETTLAAVTVLCFSLLFTMFFPAWSTLGWTVIFWAMVGVAYCATLYLNLEMGRAVRAIFYVTIAIIVGAFVVFLLDRLTGGALGFGGFRKWLLRINGSEILAAVLVLVPATLLLVSVFAKDAAAKSAFRSSAKYVGIGSVILGAFLLYKGTISWKQLSGNEPPRALTKTADKLESAYVDALDGKSSSSKALPPVGATRGDGTYLPPPSGTSVPDAPAPRTTKPRAKKQPLPPLKAKKYGDAASAVEDLESLL